jgi:hypothetical protein
VVVPPAPPPPAPPPPATGNNSSLADLKFSESFANDAATASASFPTSGATPTATAQSTTGTIAYDAAARSYTLSVQNRSLTFTPADIDPASTTATLTVYKKVNGTTTDTLTLTNPGSSGRFTYTWVGGAFWQRTVQGAAAIGGSLDALAYGVKTPGSALPRTGQAEYAVDLIGVQSGQADVVGVTGQGLMQVDFARGAITTVGTLTAPVSGPTVFSSEARLASSGNAFAGTFRYSDFGEFSGSIAGAFYGPAAQEVGAAYQARAADGRVAVGVLIGRNAPKAGANAKLTSLTANEILAADASQMATDLTGTSGMNATTGTFSASAAASTALVVNYDAAQKSYSLMSPESSQYFGPERPGAAPSLDRHSVSDTDSLSFPVPPTTGTDFRTVTNYQLLLSLEYVRAGRWLFVQRKAGPNTTYTIRDFAFGLATPTASVPRTGTAGFVIGITGTAADSDFPNLVNFGGNGTATVDFASGAITGSGLLSYREDYTMSGRAAGKGTGDFNLTATLSSSANAFNGTFALTGFGSYSGPLLGRLYGPAGQEIGGSFSATDGKGGTAVGSLVGRQDPSLTAPVPTLATLTGNTRLTALSISNPALGNKEEAYFAYDAGSQTYSFYPTAPTNGADIAYRFGPAQRTSADSTFTNYAGSGPPGQFTSNDTFTAALLNPGSGNPRIVLTYTSYADIIVRNGGTGVPTRTWSVFGIATPESQIPRTGTGTYSGIVFGHGDNGGTALDVEGSAQLSVNFGSSTFSSLLTILTRPAGSGAFNPFGTLEYTGFLSGSTISGSITDKDAQGGLRGQLYGKDAQEFGLLFNYDKNVTGSGRTQIVGGAVGKRN